MKDYLRPREIRELERVMRSPRNVALQIQPGMDLSEEVYALAASYLSADPDGSPDFFVLSPEDGKITKDAVDGLLAHARVLPVASARRVFVINNAELLTEASQNALLKTLEDEADHIAFILVLNGPVLDTILSRCDRVEVGKLPREAFPDDDDIAYYASDGVPELYGLLFSDLDFVEFLGKVPGVIGDRRGLLSLMHAVKEKDDQFFFSAADDWQWQCFMNLMKHCRNFLILQQFGVEIPDCFRRMNIEGHILDQAVRTLEEKDGKLNRNDFFEFLLKIS